MDAPGSAPDPIDRELRSLLDRSRADDAVAERRRRSALRRQAAESGTFVGSVIDLAEQGVIVTVVAGDGHHARGRIRSVGADFVGLVDEGGDTVLVCLDSASMLRAEPGTARTLGDRSARASATLMDVLVGETDRELAVRTIWNEAVTGTLESAGSDLLVLRSAGRPIYLARRGITEVRLG